MDAYLAKDARQFLEALNLLNPKPDGFLIGHQRGHRLFVEKLFSSHKGFFPSLEKFFALEDVFDNRIIGFFSFDPDEKTTNKILASFACGKLYLEIRSLECGRLDITPYIIDYDGAFSLKKIQLKS